MFKQKNTLPSAQAEMTTVNWDGEAGLGERGADVRGGIIGAFQGVLVPGLAFRNSPFVIFLNIALSGGIVAFTDGQ